MTHTPCHGIYPDLFRLDMILVICVLHKALQAWSPRGHGCELDGVARYQRLNSRSRVGNIAQRQGEVDFFDQAACYQHPVAEDVLILVDWFP
jgi:hypothetical protein